jgi:VIT1/CCC1 family predicted Fe2+/Mn2+ transporter
MKARGLQVTPTTRLKLIAAVLLLSAVYAVLVAKNPAAARTIALGYIAIMLTLLVLIQYWRRPHE